MSATVRGYPSVSRVFAVDPPRAADAFDVMILDPAVAAYLIPAGPLLRARPTNYDALRRLPATLRLPGRRARRIGVVLELLPWSNRHSELAIHTAQRPHLLVQRSVESYLRAATRSLSTLADLVDTQHLAADPTRDPDRLEAARVLAELEQRPALLPEPEASSPATAGAQILSRAGRPRRISARVGGGSDHDAVPARFAVLARYWQVLGDRGGVTSASSIRLRRRRCSTRRAEHVETGDPADAAVVARLPRRSNAAASTRARSVSPRWSR